jgi:hypothetical protein
MRFAFGERDGRRSTGFGQAVRSCGDVLARVPSLQPQWGLIVRRLRRLIAVFLVFILGFAQAVTVAHACPILNPASLPIAPTVQSEPAMPADCAEMAKQAQSTVNVCLSHCFAGPQVDAQPDAPTALVAPQPPLLVDVGSPCAPNVSAARSLQLIIAGPPPQLRFSRFLI